MGFIKVEHLNFHYEKGKTILNEINLEIIKNDMTALVGPNGSGKTTFGKLLMGILKPVSGNIYIDHHPISDMTLGQVGMKIGYLFQNPEKHFFAHTVEDEMSFILRAKDFDLDYINDRVNFLLNIFDLSHLKQAFPLRLSQGEKQRLALAAILMNDLEYLILDEPTTGLDIKRKQNLSHILKSLHHKGIGMTIISHDQAFLSQLSNRVIRLDRGDIIDDQR